MKWIIILATVLSCTTQLAYADPEDMPLGESKPVSSFQSASSLESNVSESEAPAVSGRTRSKPKTAAMPKGTDYQPAQDLLLSAMSLIGVKYTWGGNTPEAGLDCSGFIKYVFQNSMNITLPRTALGMSQTGQNIDKSELKPGDLVFFNTLGRTFSHVGIYLGDNRFIHSPRKGRNIEVANMNLSYWQTRFNGARRVADGGGSQGLNVNSLLAASSNRSKASTAAPSRESSSEASPRTKQQCKKVTTGKGKNKKTVTQCRTVSAKDTSNSVKAKSNKVRSSKATRSTKATRSKNVSTKKVARSNKSSAAKKTSSAKKKP